ncbi:LysM domain-containing protein [Blastococcus sp. TF02A-35]|uniref:LysM peptidoglycan-binding domain-containing protein n=1 Tax=Blastococcus sp. TF02A-35 TaxID=2559612 RepID=UPI001073911D|nr:LysM domain-containing protein [Blastococcus sp. TF02A_35]TFV52298.1 LysM domain-containing protein [Blastococcus sp. TF02A_35]
MSIHRLLGTVVGMAAVAALLVALSPSAGASVAALGRPQATADAAGADALVLHVVGLLAWAVWAWGAVGLALTAASALPGLAGGLASGVLRRVLPAGARQAAALALGIGLGVAPPVLATAVVWAAPAAAAAEEPVPGAGVPDWPGAPSPTVAHAGHDAGSLPDWPQAPVAGEHVVVRGDCLWDIAERRLADASGTAPAPADVARAVRAWWQANADVVGPDPDLLQPGQVLRPPSA